MKAAEKRSPRITGRLILLLLMLAVLAIAIPLSASAADAVEFDCVKPTLGTGEFAVNANGQWVKFDAAKPYSEGEGRAMAVVAPLEPVAKTLGCTLEGKGTEWTATFNGIKAPLEVVEKDGVVYASSAAWVKAFAKTGAKAMVDGSCLFLSLRTDASYTLDVDGEDFEFTAEWYEAGDGSIPYRATKINQELEGKSVLVVYLHGGSYRGNDNALQLKLNPVVDIADYLNDQHIKAVFFVPQALDTAQWAENTENFGKWLSKYAADPANNIDAERIYLMGGSMGGGGTLALVKDNPDLFASALAVSASPYLYNVIPSDITARNNLYLTVGGLETELTVGAMKFEPRVDYTHVSRVEDMKHWVTAFRAAGGLCEFDVNPAFNHQNDCEYAFTPGRLQWVFSFPREMGVEYDYVKPALEKGAYALNVNGAWVDFGKDAQPYAETATVNEKKVTTYFVPLKAVEKALPCVVEDQGEGVYAVSYRGENAVFTVGSDKVVVNNGSSLELRETTIAAPAAEKDGAVYLPLDFWAAFSNVGAKTMTDGNYIYITVRNSEPLTMDIDGEEYVFTAHEYFNTATSNYMPFRQAKVNQSSEKSALVVFLHGGSYVGNGNVAQLKLTPVRTLCEYFTDNHMNATLVVPQCALTGGWVENAARVTEWIKAYVADPANNIDPDKVYLSGCSLGCGGTWAILNENCRIFAAAMPISGSPAGLVQPRDVDIPIYAIVGGGDRASMITDMTDWCEEYENLGGEVKFDIEKTYGHVESCEYSMNAERLDWLFSFTRGDATAKAVSTFSGIASLLKNPVSPVHVFLSK